MYKTQCGHCGKDIWVYIVSKTGTVPVSYCSKQCQANAKYERRHQ